MNMKSYLEQYSHTALAMNDIEMVNMLHHCARFFRIQNLLICLRGGFT